ncbi:MAG: S8 family serine peptidase [Xanthomonadales bacterium]|nr:S8 family serine peptidase [Xanthomonadales bacterium]
MIKKPLYIAMTAQLLVSTMSDAGTKIIVKNGEKLAGADSAALIQDYGSFKLYELDRAKAINYAAKSHNISVVNEMNELLFESFRFNTQSSHVKSQLLQEAKFVDGEGIQVIQFVGPIKDEWLKNVEQAGAKLIHYVANNGYLVWTDEASREQLNQMADSHQFIQFSAPYTDIFKLGTTVAERMNQNPNSDEVVNVNIQLADSPFSEKSIQIINSLVESVNAPWNQVMNFHSVRVSIKLKNISKVLELADSYWVNEYFERSLNDEVQNQILVADFAVGNAEPAMPGYADFLSNKGFPTTPNSYPVVDITDDGIGNGTTASGDPTFHEGGQLANPTRLSYVANCTNASSGEGVDGHGHINTSIVGGFESRTGFPYVDPNGYIRTQGVNPFTRLAGTRIFSPGFSLSACGGTDAGLIQSVQDNGAQIMSNSWGCGGCAGSYDDSSQAFDVGVRDADLNEAGNQELIMIFAAGNDGSGAGTVGTPGNGKNMITVGASENYRPNDENGSWTDGCGIGSTGADNAMDVIGFSSRGPSPGGRTKPEVIAPGTHIHGTASTNGSYTGNSVCDQYRPGSQTVVAASSGTSHSTPAVAGVASLAYYWMENPLPTMLGTFGTPSPAMMKAYLVAHPTYLTGVSANDNLPSNSQGYGMPNMTLMFDDTLKFLYDQNIVFDNTGENWTWVGSAADPSKPVRIVMTYTDQAGAQGTSPQVNNLDLQVETNGDTYLGNNFTNEYSVTGGTADSVNNYEAVFLPAGTANNITITVSAANIAGDGIPNTGDGTDQDFALVCYNCAQDPTFTLSAATDSLDVCAPNDAVYGLTVGSILGYQDDVTLSTSGLPAGATESFSVNPVTPAGSSDFTIGNTGGVAAGSYTVTVNGTAAGPINKSIDVTLNLYNGVPGGTTLTLPADTATGVDIAGTSFSWDPTTDATGYTFELSDMSDFSNIIETATSSGTSHTSALTLNPDTTYYWRVYANNICGDATPVGQFSFTTLVPPGECSSSQIPNVVYEYDFESGLNGWSSDTLIPGDPDLWAESGVRTHSGSSAMLAVDVANLSDQILVSPPIAVPVGETPVSLSFWNHQTMEDRTGGCYDGGILEVSTDGGNNYTQVDTSKMLTDPYDGPMSNGFNNPLADQDAWCGDPQDWLNSVVDLVDYEGQTVQFRFRMATDTSVSREGWYIDDIKVQSCQTGIDPCDPAPPVGDPDIIWFNGFQCVQASP